MTDMLVGLPGDHFVNSGLDAKCVEGVILPSRLGGLGGSSRVQGGAPAKNNCVAFCTRKMPLVNRILLNVAKGCVIELLE